MSQSRTNLSLSACFSKKVCKILRLPPHSYQNERRTGIWRSNSWTAFFVEVSGHKLESSQTRVFYPHFPFYKILFMNRLEFPCFTDFFVCIFKTRAEYGFLQNPPEEGTENSIEQKTRVFCQIDVQEFHFRTHLLTSKTRNILARTSSGDPSAMI